MASITALTQPPVAGRQAVQARAAEKAPSVAFPAGRSPRSAKAGSISIPSASRSAGARVLSSSFVAPKARVVKTHASSKVVMAAKDEPLRVIIAGAPASGKGTQCETIVEKYGLTHISVGDLLRAEVAAGTENGKRAKEFMDNGALVPDEVVIGMVKGALANAEVRAVATAPGPGKLSTISLGNSRHAPLGTPTFGEVDTLAVVVRTP